MEKKIELTEEIKDKAKDWAERVNKNPKYHEGVIKTGMALCCLSKFLGVEFDDAVPEKGRFIIYKDKTLGAKVVGSEHGGIYFNEQGYFNKDVIGLLFYNELENFMQVQGFLTKEAWLDKSYEKTGKYGPYFAVNKDDLKAPEDFLTGTMPQLPFDADDIPF